MDCVRDSLKFPMGSSTVLNMNHSRERIRFNFDRIIMLLNGNRLVGQIGLKDTRFVIEHNSDTVNPRCVPLVEDGKINRTVYLSRLSAQRLAKSKVEDQCLDAVN